MKKCILIVMDSVGIGELPDAEYYGDRGSNTICNIREKTPGFTLQNLEKMGLGNIQGSKFPKCDAPIGAFGKMAEVSAGKDTTTGHWEIAGLNLKKAFPVYKNGFPDEIMKEFEKQIGSGTLGNYPASGTEIIQQLGDQHVKTGFPIAYTSADSVFQIAAHEEVIPLDRLYKLCEIARNILHGEHAVGRVIARPFVGKSGEYKRTANRRDFSLQPFGKTILDNLKESGRKVKAVGKIEDIFNGAGITDSVHTHSNNEGVDCTIEYMREEFDGLIFTNLVDFDMLYGHRNDVGGYANALAEFDARIPEIISEMGDDDILIITADHGCDPTFPGSDHTREYVPVFVYGKNINPGFDLGVRASFSDIAATITDYFGLSGKTKGESFYSSVRGS